MFFFMCAIFEINVNNKLVPKEKIINQINPKYINVSRAAEIDFTPLC